MIRLIPQDETLFDALLEPDAFRERYAATIAESDVQAARNVVRHTREFGERIGARAPWGGYLSVCVDSDSVIGFGGFKGNPDEEGAVEIAYFTFPPYEGRGFATATAQELTAIACGEPGILSVLAHTLPEPGASTRILQKLGFARVGDVVDPEDGPVWRWHRSLAATAGAR